MKKTLLILASILALAAPAHARKHHAAVHHNTQRNIGVRITHDIGGSVANYAQRFNSIRLSGQNVIIDGLCASACTLVTGMVPPDKICVTGRARLAFHRVKMTGTCLGDDPVASEQMTGMVYDRYPSQIQSWIDAHGGMMRDNFVYMPSRDLKRIFRSCG